MQNKRFYLSVVVPVLIALILLILRQLPISNNFYVSLTLSIISILVMIYILVYLLKVIKSESKDKIKNKAQIFHSLIVVIISLFTIWFIVMDVINLFK
nr:hypothetical protein [Tissierella sp.]